MIKIKKLAAILLTSAMLFAFAACDENGGANPPAATTTPETTTTAPEPTLTPEAPEETEEPEETEKSEETEPPSGGEEIFIPDNGTPPDVSGSVNGLMESHRGDKAYFYTTTDDYVVYMVEDNVGGLYRYILYNFSDDTNYDGFVKTVFDSNENAENYAQSSSSLIAIDNVVYVIDAHPDDGWTKSAFTRWVQNNAVDYYISKP